MRRFDGIACGSASPTPRRRRRTVRVRELAGCKPPARKASSSVPRIRDTLAIALRRSGPRSAASVIVAPANLDKPEPTRVLAIVWHYGFAALHIIEDKSYEFERP